MPAPGKNAARSLWPWAALCTLLISRAPAQKLNWTEPSLIGVPYARCCAPSVYDTAMGATLLYGGATYSINPATIFEGTWEFSKTTGWKQLAPPVSPPPLEGPGMAYDPTTGTAVLFGGYLGNYVTSNETWTWDGVTWTQQFPPVSPPPRTWNTSGMVFDSLVGKVVMFGGWNYTGVFSFMNDTWEWDGTSKTWTEKFPAHSPSPRAAALAYDEATRRVLLFGGLTSQSTFTGDTWTYDGVDWAEQEPTTTPPARCDNALAFNPNLHAVVMFGGLAGASESGGEPRLNDTWLWGGRNWTQVQTPTSPGPSSGTSFDYDATVNDMLLFGGFVGSYSYTNATWLF